MASDPFLSEIQIFSFNFTPRGWAACNGQLLPIAQNAALFSLLGTNYGGNGQTNFALPNLQGRVPMHIGGGLVQGQVGGEELHTLTIPEMAAHTHPVTASGATVNQPSPGGMVWAKGAQESGYAATVNAQMNPACVTNTGGSQPHENRMPFLVLNFCIAIQGIFPSRN